jgi:putative flippase GtrA
MASTIGAAVGALVNYFLNYHITFKSITDHFSGMTKYFIVAVAAIFLNFIIMSFLVVNLQINYMIVQIFSSMITLSLAYVINARWSFYQ